MAEKYSDQMTMARATPRERIPTDQWHGRMRRRYFTYTVPTGGDAINDTVQLTELESGWRIYGGQLLTDGLGTGAQANVGDGTTADKYGSALDLAAAGEKDFGRTLALNWGEKVGKPFILTATVINAVWTAGKKLHGYIEYMHD